MKINVYVGQAKTIEVDDKYAVMAQDHPQCRRPDKQGDLFKELVDEIENQLNIDYCSADDTKPYVFAIESLEYGTIDEC